MPCNSVFEREPRTKKILHGRRKTSLCFSLSKTIDRLSNSRAKRDMAPPSPASFSPSSDNVPLFADKHVEFVAGFSKVIEKEKKAT